MKTKEICINKSFVWGSQHSLPGVGVIRILKSKTNPIHILDVSFEITVTRPDREGEELRDWSWIIEGQVVGEKVISKSIFPARTPSDWNEDDERWLEEELIDRAAQLYRGTKEYQERFAALLRDCGVKSEE